MGEVTPQEGDVDSVWTYSVYVIIIVIYLVYIRIFPHNFRVPSMPSHAIKARNVRVLEDLAA